MREFAILKNRIMSYTKTLVFLLLVPIYILPQNLIIQDIETREPLPGVNVYSASTGTTTDTNGVCNLDEFSDDDEILFSHIGYEKIKAVKHNLTGTLHLRMYSIPINSISVLSLKSKKTKKKVQDARAGCNEGLSLCYTSGQVAG